MTVIELSVSSTIDDFSKEAWGHSFYENYIIINHGAMEFSTGALREMSESVNVSITTILINDVCICNMHVCV